MVDYGIDAPGSVKDLYWRTGTLAAIGLGIFFMNRAENPGPAAALLVVFLLGAAVSAGLAMYKRWSSQTGKLAMRDKLLDKIQWTGDEKVLDVGCGRGLLAVGAAKRLKKGRVTGIDLWVAESLSDNKLEHAVANAKEEGVADRVKIENGDVRKLTYGDKSFDVVLSMSVLHELMDSDERVQALREMMRVTKPGGTVALFDVGSGVSEYAGVLREAGAEQVAESEKSWLWLVPGRILVARKRT